MKGSYSLDGFDGLPEDADLDAFIDALADSYQSLEERLEAAHCSYDEMHRALQKFIAQFYLLTSKYSLDADNKFICCKELQEKASSMADDELEFLLHALLFEKGILFNQFDEERTLEQDLQCYLDLLEEKDILSASIKKHQRYAVEFRSLADYKPKNRTAANAPSNYLTDFLLTKIIEFFPKESKGCNDTLAYNISLLCATLDDNPALQRVAPFFIFQVTTGHLSRFCRNETFNYDYEKLWSYNEFKIATDNGKNFKRHQLVLQFFLDLCDFFSDQEGFDPVFSHYCFANTSNLNEWFHTNCQVDEQIPLDLPTAMIIERAPLDFFYKCKAWDYAPKEHEAFYKNEVLIQRLDQKIATYLESNPQLLETYGKNLLKNNTPLIYQTFDEATLPLDLIDKRQISLIHEFIEITFNEFIAHSAKISLFQAANQLAFERKQRL